MRTKQNNKQGVSLIVLVITIIIMIILAGAVVITLNNSGIIKKSSDAVIKTNVAQIKQMAEVWWAEAYMAGDTTQQALETYILAKFAENDISAQEYSLVVTTKGVTVEYIPENWRGKVTTIVAGVPIPKGFVASQATGENTKNGGLVIYEGTEPVTNLNVENAKRNRNQYVWVPVDNFNDFVRSTFNNQYIQLTNNLGSTDYSFWEVALDLTTNMPDVDKNKEKSTYISTVTPQGKITNTLSEVQSMYESVKEYKGFYIARYEAGLDITNRRKKNDGLMTKPFYSMMNKAPYNYAQWSTSNTMNVDTGAAVELARGVYPENNQNYGAVSTLVYGVQWDRTLSWWIETKAQNGTKDATITSENDLVNKSYLFGNYTNNDIPNSHYNEGASYSKNFGDDYTLIDNTYNRPDGERRILTTGASDETRVNNIYDMAGNLWEWTMEGRYTNNRVYRGGGYFNKGSDCPVHVRNEETPITTASNFGFRVALYIKN